MGTYSNQLIEAKSPLKVKADLRAFGAIGFQDLWLDKQGYKNQSLIKRIADSAIDRGVDVVGLTSEDDCMLAGKPEDRLGFLKSEWIPLGYEVHEVDEDILRVLRTERGKEGITYIVNCETRHPKKGQDWRGLKLHVVGGNLLPKDLDLKESIKDANDRGYLTFLMNASTPEAQQLADELRGQYTGIIGYDANNTFANWATRIPILGPRVKSYSKERNDFAKRFARETGLPSIATSSAHWMHEIGRACIEFDIPEEEVFSLDLLREVIQSRQFNSVEGHNNPFDVIRFGYMLGKYGGNPDRFKGMDSSYNTQEL